MEIRIGDKVRFLTEKMEGKVTGVIDPRTVEVYCDEYGFEIPASVNDLVVIQPTSGKSSATPASTAPVLPGGEDKPATDTLHLAFVPEKGKQLADSRFELYLVNDTPLTVLYSAATLSEGQCSGLSAGSCNPGSVSELGSFTLKELDDVEQFSVQALFFKKGNYPLRPAIDTTVKIKPVSLCKAGSYHKERWFSLPVLMRSLETYYPPVEEMLERLPEEGDKQWKQVKSEKKAGSTEPSAEKPITGRVLEIDLHAGEILETLAGMDSKDILEYQLDLFRKTLDENKLKRGQKIVFIHGKGDGVLRQRILWELQTQYKRFRHQDASFKQYGYGATLVTIL